MSASKAIGKDFHFRNACPEIPNTTYLTHGLHSYPAKFIPHIPRWFLGKYSQLRSTVLDPFCGSGTALVEANMLGMHALGVDINPLSSLLVRAKTEVVEDPDGFAAACLSAVPRCRDYPPDYDPRRLPRNKGAGSIEDKIMIIRTMAPFHMRCTTCGTPLQRL